MDPVLQISHPAPHVELWTIHRPRARNAINDQLATELGLAVNRVAGMHRGKESGAARAVILTGSGQEAFVSGADLKFLRDASEEQRVALDRRMLKLLDDLQTLPVPVLAAINGYVMGGGCELSLACDMRIAEAHASFTFKHAAMGVTPGWGGFARLTALVPRGAAAQLLMTAEPMLASEALRVGLVEEVCDEGQAVQRCTALASASAALSPDAVAAMKQLLTGSRGLRADELRVLERECFEQRVRSMDHQEALRAFFEKRQPRFR